MSGLNHSRSGGVRDDESYRALVAPLARSSASRVGAFAEFISRDHSWYKKLPFEPPGHPFFVYLDPHVHQALVPSQDGASTAFRDIVSAPHPIARDFRIDTRTGDQPVPAGAALRYHARGHSTEEWRERHGYWTYSDPFLACEPGDAAREAFGSITVRSDSRYLVPVPVEVLELGLVYLRATVSPDLGPALEEYEAAQKMLGLPDPANDRDRQLVELDEAMTKVLQWVRVDVPGRPTGP